MPADVVIRALRHVWRALAPLELPMALAGGIALAAWKHIRTTRDVDLMLNVEGQNLADLLETLRAAGIRPKRDPPLVPLGHLDVLQLLYEPPETFLELQIDLLLATGEYSRQAIERAVEMRLPEADLEVSVLACEDLILHKVLAERAIDVADAESLLRANRPSLQFDYLAEWSEKLNVRGQLSDIWRRAFPGEPLPPPLENDA